MTLKNILYLSNFQFFTLYENICKTTNKHFKWGAIVYPIWTYRCLFSSECLSYIHYFPPSVALLLVMIFQVQKERLPFKRRNAVYVALCFIFRGKDVPITCFCCYCWCCFCGRILLHWQILGMTIWNSEIFKVKYCFDLNFNSLSLKCF